MTSLKAERYLEVDLTVATAWGAETPCQRIRPTEKRGTQLANGRPQVHDVEGVHCPNAQGQVVTITYVHSWRPTASPSAAQPARTQASAGAATTSRRGATTSPAGRWPHWTSDRGSLGLPSQTDGLA